jgi:hypothetical protein
MEMINISYDKTKSFIGSFDKGEISANETFKNKNIEAKTLLVCPYEVDFNHSFFQGFFNEMIVKKLNIDFIDIDDSANEFTKEAFQFAKETWDYRR